MAQQTSYGGNMTPNRMTHYSQRDVEEARGSLALLKKRLSNSRDRHQKPQTIDYASKQPRGHSHHEGNLSGMPGQQRSHRN